METKILLEKNRSEHATNVDENIHIDFASKTRFLPEEDLAKDVSLYQQYLDEKDSSKLYRMIFAVNPICSNVLFNAKTEIVKGEGSKDCVRVTATTSFAASSRPTSATSNQKLTYLQMMRDTEYSHPSVGEYVYHCGLDIFNNHRLRANGFIHVNKPRDNDATCAEVYNTIKDYKRNSVGYIESGITDAISNTVKPLHLYGYDTLYSFRDAYENNLNDKNGWFGFTNTTTLNSNNTKFPHITINKVMNNNKPCEFIDMYPDRSLYSFIPKYNKYRNRQEKNWDYCITYPYSCDYEKINTICGGDNGAIRAFCTVGLDSGGRNSLKCISQFKHTLKVKDTIMLYYYDGGVLTGLGKVKITEVGNSDGSDTEHAFSIKYEDVSRVIDRLGSLDQIYYKKVVGNLECNYYFRVFKKIKNGNNELKSDIGKIAFAENIYGDGVAQVVFTDDINVDGLVDNLGRPLSEVYFTVMKRNKGHEEWNSGNYTGSSVEFSHCFGTVTSGLHMPKMEVDPSLKNYNVRYINSVPISSSVNNILGRTLKTFSSGFTGSNNEATIFGATPLENNITIDNDTFYGDVVEFDIYNFEEHVIENVYHRFNTTQRESSRAVDSGIAYDMISGDDYDANGFNITTYYLDSMTSEGKNDTSWSTGNTNSILGAIMPEGYYYNPHTKVKIREISESVSETEAQFINFGAKGFNYTFMDSENKYAIISMISPIDYSILKGDIIAFYDKNTQLTYWGNVESVSGTSLNVMVNANEVPSIKVNPSSTNRTMYAFHPVNSVPYYGMLVLSRMKFMWKTILADSEVPQTSDIFDRPFANGRHYVEQNVNFFVRRQDPHGENHLSVAVPVWGRKYPLKDYIVKGEEPLDLSAYLYIGRTLTDICY